MIYYTVYYKTRLLVSYNQEDESGELYQLPHIFPIHHLILSSFFFRLEEPSSILDLVVLLLSDSDMTRREEM